MIIQNNLLIFYYRSLDRKIEGTEQDIGYVMKFNIAPQDYTIPS